MCTLEPATVDHQLMMNTTPLNLTVGKTKLVVKHGYSTDCRTIVLIWGNSDLGMSPGRIQIFLTLMVSRAPAYGRDCCLRAFRRAFSKSTVTARIAA